MKKLTKSGSSKGLSEKSSNTRGKSSVSVDTMLYNETSLNLLTIRDLRDIGRKFGVPSPTTLSKDELINYILKIVYGEVSVPVRKPMGRPNVREFNLEGYLERIRKNTPIVEELSKVRLYSSDTNLGELKIASPSKNHGVSLNGIETRVLCEADDKYFLRINAYLAGESDIEISKELIKKFNLEKFDVLEIIENNHLFKIVSINGILVKDKFEGLTIDDHVLVSGTNQVFYTHTKEKIEEDIRKLEKVCENNGLEVLIFSENKYTGRTTKCFDFSKEEGNSLVYKKFMCMLGECERLTLECNDIVLIIENLRVLDEIINTFDYEVSKRIKQNINEEIEKFTKLGNICVKFSEEIASDY